MPDVIGGEAGDYILRVRGESMVDAGILEGDFVVVRPADDADNGEIVVALVGDEEATVKRFFREKDHVRLQPENKAMKPIRTRDATVLGRVVGVFGGSRERHRSSHRDRDRARRSRAIRQRGCSSRRGRRSRTWSSAPGRTSRLRGRAECPVCAESSDAAGCTSCGSELSLAQRPAHRSETVPRDRASRVPLARELGSRGGACLRGKSGHHRARRWVTPTRGNPRESATETDTADGAATRESRTGKGEMVR